MPRSIGQVLYSVACIPFILCCLLFGYLSEAYYHVLKHVGRNDYFYLCSSECSSWWLRQKLEHKENLAHVNRYHVAHVVRFGTVACECQVTPLHQAIQRGNLQKVVLLCHLGMADPHLKVKFVFDHDASVLNPEWTEEMNKWRKLARADLSAVKLARELAGEEKNSDVYHRIQMYLDSFPNVL